MKKFNFVFALLLLLSCTSDKETLKIVNDNNSIDTRSVETLSSNIIFNGLVYPAGTTITGVGNNRIEIQLPTGYYFVVQEPNMSIYYSSTECYECKCTKNGPSGCDVLYNYGGFGCDHFGQCEICEGKKVKCATSSTVQNTIAIIDSTDGFRFITSTADYESLSDFQINDSLVSARIYDTLDWTNLKSQLFTSNYFILNQPEDSAIMISAYRNKIFIAVKADWRDYVNLDLDEDFYNIALPIPTGAQFVCECVKGPNPFDIISGTCIGMNGWPLSIYRCHNSNCGHGCRLTLIEH